MHKQPQNQQRQIKQPSIQGMAHLPPLTYDKCATRTIGGNAICFIVQRPAHACRPLDHARRGHVTNENVLLAHAGEVGRSKCCCALEVANNERAACTIGDESIACVGRRPTKAQCPRQALAADALHKDVTVTSAREGVAGGRVKPGSPLKLACEEQASATVRGDCVATVG
eukprot:4832861-Prymnesium_polylepis.1